MKNSGHTYAQPIHFSFDCNSLPSLFSFYTYKRLIRFDDINLYIFFYVHIYVVRVMSDLFENLQAKAKREKKPALAHIFLLNNCHFIYKTIKNSNFFSEVKEQLVLEYQNQCKAQKEAYLKWLQLTLITFIGKNSAVISFFLT
jgi:hypothetical protein